MTALIYKDKLYAANAGDCKGIVVFEDNNGFGFRKINHMLNANSKKEQVRLRSLFSTEKDIVVCKRGNSKACYVKSCL